MYDASCVLNYALCKDEDMLESTTCLVCTSDVLRRDLVKCHICHKGACRDCTQTFLLTQKHANCMFCREPWMYTLLKAHFNPVWFRTVYKKHLKQTLLTDITTSFSAYSHFVSFNKEKLAMKSQLNNIASELAAQRLLARDNASAEISPALAKLSREYETANQAYMLYSDQLDEALQIDATAEDMDKKLGLLTNVFSHKNSKKCPLENCKGFLDQQNCCTICSHVICTECGCKSDTDHKCNADDQAAYQLISSTSKPCPNCRMQIFKDSGCKHMWCTNCHFGFDWETLQPISHRFNTNHMLHDWLKSQRENTSQALMDEEIQSKMKQFLSKFNATLVAIFENQIKNFPNNLQEGCHSAYFSAAEHLVYLVTHDLSVACLLDAYKKLLRGGFKPIEAQDSPMLVRLDTASFAQINRIATIRFLSGEFDEEQYKHYLSHNFYSQERRQWYAITNSSMREKIELDLIGLLKTLKKETKALFFMKTTNSHEIEENITSSTANPSMKSTNKRHELIYKKSVVSKIAIEKTDELARILNAFSKKSKSLMRYFNAQHQAYAIINNIDSYPAFLKHTNDVNPSLTQFFKLVRITTKNQYNGKYGLSRSVKFQDLYSKKRKRTKQEIEEVEYSDEP